MTNSEEQNSTHTAWNWLSMQRLRSDGLCKAHPRVWTHTHTHTLLPSLKSFSSTRSQSYSHHMGTHKPSPPSILTPKSNTATCTHTCILGTCQNIGTALLDWLQQDRTPNKPNHLLQPCTVLKSCPGEASKGSIGKLQCKEHKYLVHFNIKALSASSPHYLWFALGFNFCLFFFFEKI